MFKLVADAPDGLIPHRVAGVDRLLASYDKAERLIGWKPQYGGLEGFIRDEQVNWSLATGEFKGFEIVR